ncbi:MAG: Crp/Fnr family transcriptional regulator [Negativicutes bacterium]|nr:Crp/Fnr family transcriptional regulator [Negativicutes bacterium]
MKNKMEILKRTPLFKGMSEEEISSVLCCLEAKESTYEKNSFIFSLEATRPTVGIILSGSVVVIKEDFWGNRSILTKLGSGDIFGEAFTCAQAEKLPVGVLASEKCEVLFIDYLKIINTPETHYSFQNKLIQNMLVILAAKNVMLTQKIEHLMKRSTREKILSYLSAQALEKGGHIFDITLSRQEMADYLAVDRSALSNELSKLQKEGFLTFRRNHFELKTEE